MSHNVSINDVPLTSDHASSDTQSGADISAPKAVLEVTGLAQRVASGEGRLTILEQLELCVNAGESVAIIGASGSGKSTLLGLLAGLDSPTEGDIRLFGTSLAGLDEDGRAALRAGQVGFVFQNFQLLPTLTALENVLMPLELAPQGDIEAKARDWLGRVGLAERMDHLPRHLSGGEQQRVAIARAFVAGPGLVFADEPTGNLDTATGDRIADLLFTLNRERGTTLILVTHDLTLARRCDRCLNLEAGNLVEWQDGTSAPAVAPLQGGQDV